MSKLAKKSIKENPNTPEYKQKIDFMEKDILEMSDRDLHYLLDVKWYPRDLERVVRQRKIWDYSYLSYKGILLWDEINRKRRKDAYGIFINVPRTYSTVEGIRRNMNINRLTIDIDKGGLSDMELATGYKIVSMVNYDLDRSRTREQVKDAGFNKLVFGNGFLYSFLVDRVGNQYIIGDSVDEETGRVKYTTKKNQNKYYGMVARSISIYNIIPDRDGVHHDVNNHVDRMCGHVCIRSVKHIADFRRDWKGIVPDKILMAVQPGGLDMDNYEAVREMTDYLFDVETFRYDDYTISDFVVRSNIVTRYNSNEFVEERLWLGENFMILQAGKGMKICLVSPNPNPLGLSSLVKLDDVRIPGEYWAMGEPYIQRYQQIEENRLHNSILDLIHFCVSGMIGIQTNYLEDPNDIEIYPEKVWKFKAIPGIKIDDVMQNFQASPAAIPSAMKFLQEVKTIGQSATSITDFVTGATESIANSATETNKLAGASDLTIVDKIREMVSGAMIEICNIWYSQYPIVYRGKKLEYAYKGDKIYFTGREKDSFSEAELKKLLIEYPKMDVTNIIFNDDLSSITPSFKVIGDIEISKDVKLAQYQAAINFSKDINDQAFNTGDPRRIDVIQMGIDAMHNFDVISDPSVYLLKDQKTKMDMIDKQTQANIDQANASAATKSPVLVQNPQEQNGGRPVSKPSNQPKSAGTNMRSAAQPKK
jgi:hypothetical protein